MGTCGLALIVLAYPAGCAEAPRRRSAGGTEFRAGGRGRNFAHLRILVPKTIKGMVSWDLGPSGNLAQWVRRGLEHETGS